MNQFTIFIDIVFGYFRPFYFAIKIEFFFFVIQGFFDCNSLICSYNASTKKVCKLFAL